MNTDSIDPAELDAYDAWLAEHLDELVRCVRIDSTSTLVVSLSNHEQMGSSFDKLRTSGCTKASNARD